MTILRWLQATLLAGLLAAGATVHGDGVPLLRDGGERSQANPMLLAQAAARPDAPARATGTDSSRDQQTRLLQQRAAEQREAANRRLRAQREQQAAADRAQRQCGALDARASHLAAQSHLPPADPMAADRLRQERRMLRDDRRRMGCR